ncbi:MAG: CvpA family protein [Campylobacterota bacterium]|nr:CvpA family protein [Campylobacterota bacterium]
MENTNIFDIIVLVLIFFLGLKGLFRGFIKELFGIAGIVGGVYIASRLSEDVAQIIKPMFAMESDSAAILIGFILILALIWIVVYLIGMGVSKASQLSGLGPLDRMLGFIFGAGKIFLIFSIIAYSLSSVEAIKSKIKDKTKNSLMYPILKDAGAYIVKLDTTKLTQNVKNEVAGAVNSAKQTVKDIAQSEAVEAVKEYKDQVVNSNEESSNGN